MDTQSPILLIGTQRSGTTWLGGVFSRHPRLAYWSEPRHVWTWGNAYRGDDRLTADHARAAVIRHIRATFDRFVAGQGRDRLVEKTPSNCLRLPFLRAVYPSAKIILIVRDGRAVIRSTGDELEKGVPTGRIARRAFETPLWEWPAYAGRAAATLTRKAARRPLKFWGPRPPGWRDWVRTDPTDVVLAKQWAATILTAWEDAKTIPADRLLTIRYDELMAAPREVMGRVVEFADLADAEALIDHVAQTADPVRASKWKQELDAATLDAVRPHLEPALRTLGYDW